MATVMVTANSRKSMSAAQRLVGLGVCGSLMLAYTTTSPAWQFTPEVNAGLIYTDNVELAPDNEEEELILELGAGFSAERQGGRLNSTINYSVQGLAYAEDDRRNEAFHQLDASATLAVSPEQFFIEGDSSISQQLIDRRRGGSANNVFTNDNRLTVFTASVGPRLEQRIGDSLFLQANARTAIVEELESDSSTTAADVDSTQNSVAASLGNIPDGQSLQWTLQYEQIRTDSENDDETRQETASLTLLYPVSRTVSLLGVAGEERNTFARNANSDEPDGSFWEAGVIWQASAQDAIELRRGERFFGDTTTFSWQHEARRLTSDISYNEDVTTTTQNLISGGNGLTQITGEASISKQLNAGLSYSLPRSTVSVNIYETRNEFQLTLTEDRTQGMTSGWLWDVGSRTQLSIDLTLEHGEFNNRVDENDSVDFDVEVSRRLGPKTTATLGYAYSELESNIVANEYEANTLTFTFNRTF